MRFSGGRRSIRSEWFNSPVDGVSYPVAAECFIRSLSCRNHIKRNSMCVSLVYGWKFHRRLRKSLPARFGSEAEPFILTAMGVARRRQPLVVPERELLLGHFYRPEILSITHTLTLGCISMLMMARWSGFRRARWESRSSHDAGYLFTFLLS